MLLTKKIRETLPALYAQKSKGDDAIVHVKFFCPWNAQTWYITEGNLEEDDYIFFGLFYDGREEEWGYSSLNEFTSVKHRSGLGIERDRHWKPITVRELKKDLNVRI